MSNQILIQITPGFQPIFWSNHSLFVAYILPAYIFHSHIFLILNKPSTSILVLQLLLWITTPITMHEKHGRLIIAQRCSPEKYSRQRFPSKMAQQGDTTTIVNFLERFP